MSVLLRRQIGGALMLAAVCGLSFPAVSQAQLVHDPSKPTYTQVAKRVSQKRRVPNRFNRRTVRYRTSEKPGTIVIETRNHYLYYVLGKGKAFRYGVGLGRNGFGWKGTVRIGHKKVWPRWQPPAAMIKRDPLARKYRNGMAGGVNNPLGARALYLFEGGRDTLYRIHGTNEPWTIGLNVSSGCIRLKNSDVKHLYKHAKIGAKVVVR